MPVGGHCPLTLEGTLAQPPSFSRRPALQRTSRPSTGAMQTGIGRQTNTDSVPFAQRRGRERAQRVSHGMPVCWHYTLTLEGTLAQPPSFPRRPAFQRKARPCREKVQTGIVRRPRSVPFAQRKRTRKSEANFAGDARGQKTAHPSNPPTPKADPVTIHVIPAKAGIQKGRATGTKGRAHQIPSAQSAVQP